MDYTLHLDSGELVDSSEGHAPLEFIYGKGHIIPGLERELEGLEVGDEKSIRVSPEEGYGVVNPEAIRTISRDQFPTDIELEIGMMLYVKQPDGQAIPFLVQDLTEDTVTVDFNHPLAGESLNFKVCIRNIREATPDELLQGRL